VKLRGQDDDRVEGGPEVDPAQPGERPVETGGIVAPDPGGDRDGSLLREDPTLGVALPEDA
jgi:hypothetical protein